MGIASDNTSFQRNRAIYWVPTRILEEREEIEIRAGQPWAWTKLQWIVLGQWVALQVSRYPIVAGTPGMYSAVRPTGK